MGHEMFDNTHTVFYVIATIMHGSDGYLTNDDLRF